MKTPPSVIHKSVASLLLTLLALTGIAQAATGPEIAQLLNRNFQYTPRECAGGKPAFFCSGVLARVNPASTEFWKHGEVASQLGAESFAYLRADLGTQTLTHANGVVFSDGFTAISQGKTLDVLCAYPFALTLQGSRPDFGCGWVAPTTNVAEDPSSCAALGIGDAPGWLQHFGQHHQEPSAQCSLSSLQPTSFYASLVAHESLHATWSTKPTQLQLRNWDANAPKQMPILGLFYDVTQPGALLAVQRDQQDYFKAAGDWLPILRMNLGQAPAGVFGFNQQDQLYTGYEVAARMNARYAQTSPTCREGKTAYYCNGVLLRGTQASPLFHMWNPSPKSVENNGVSFTYLRQDAQLTKLVFRQGFIIRESFAPTTTPLVVMCAYPFDGASSRPTDTCRVRGPTCDEAGVTRVEEWAKRYGTAPRNSCAFNNDPVQFQLNIDVRVTVPNGDGWNEVMVQTWPQDIPLQIPLEAFYYSPTAHYAGKGLLEAQFAQRDYFQTTGRFLPVVLVDLAATDGQVFSYRPEEQNEPGEPAARLFLGPDSDL